MIYLQKCVDDHNSQLNYLLESFLLQQNLRTGDCTDV